MKSFVTIFCSCLFAASAFSQKDTSTLRSITGLMEQQIYSTYKQQAAALHLNPVQHFAVADLYASAEKGDFRAVQTPGSTKRAGFSSEGMKKVDNFWVHGNFGYERQWDEDVMKSFRRDPKDRSPYYLWTPRTGDMNHEVYHLDGQFATTLAKNKLWVGAGAIYDASDNYRTIDPRPFINYFNFQVKAIIGYQLSKQHLLVVEPFTGYGKENTSAYSKNNDSTNAASYQVYRAEGLVEVSSGAESKRQLNQWRNYNGLQVGHYVTNVIKGTLNLGYKYKVTNERSFNRFYNPTTELKYGDLHTYDHQAQAGWFRKQEKWLAALQWQMNLSKARDYNYYLSGNNYTSFERSNKFTAGFSLYENNRPESEWLVSFAKTVWEQKDGNNSAAASYRYNLYDIQYRKNIYCKTMVFQVTGNVGWQQNNNSSFEMPAAGYDFLFVPSVVYPNAEYYTANSRVVGLKLSSVFIASKKLRWGIDIGVQEVHQMSEGYYYINSSFHPGTQRTTWNAALRFYL